MSRCSIGMCLVLVAVAGCGHFKSGSAPPLLLHPLATEVSRQTVDGMLVRLVREGSEYHVRLRPDSWTPASVMVPNRLTVTVIVGQEAFLPNGVELSRFASARSDDWKDALFLREGWDIDFPIQKLPPRAKIHIFPPRLGPEIERYCREHRIKIWKADVILSP